MGRIERQYLLIHFQRKKPCRQSPHGSSFIFTLSLIPPPYKTERILARSVAGVSVFLEHEGVAQVEGAALLLAVGAEPELRRAVAV